MSLPSVQSGLGQIASRILEFLQEAVARRYHVAATYSGGQALRTERGRSRWRSLLVDWITATNRDIVPWPQSEQLEYLLPTPPPALAGER